ncbi:MAG: hypothetical protein WCP28_02585 [Actinomycetes bacterium]
MSRDAKQPKTAQVRKLLGRRERLLAWAEGPPKLDGQPTVVAVSDRALYAPGYLPRLRWEYVLKAIWDDPILEVFFLIDPDADGDTGPAAAAHNPVESLTVREDDAAASIDGASESSAPIVVGAEQTGFVRITLDSPGAVPQIAWERINASIVLQRQVPLVGDRGVRLVARRMQATQDIAWFIVFDRGLDQSDPQLLAIAQRELRYLRESAGI